MKIRYRYGRAPLEIEAETMKEAIKKAVANGINLSNADLSSSDLRGSDLSGTDLSGANLDYSCWPLCYGSLRAKIDKHRFIQLLYHTVRAGQSVEDEEVQKFLNMPEVIALANQFHRVNECGKIEKKEVKA